MWDATTKADLRTAQNSVHSFIGETVAEARSDGTIRRLVDNRTAHHDFAHRTEDLLLDLLALHDRPSGRYRMAITDSGKRAIEVMVNAFCSANRGQTAAMANENYVGHNKWSAATAMEKLNNVPFVRPFEVDLSHALTGNATPALDRAKELIQCGIETLYLAWNATSTGVVECPEDLVRHRDSAASDTLILADASSLDILDPQWADEPTKRIPDAFFFSCRKHTAIPYDGPQDEIEQMKNSGAVLVFNQRALERARWLGADPIYGVTVAESVEDRIPQGEKHATHLIRLNSLLRHVLADGGSALRAIDETKRAAKREIIRSFSEEGSLGRLGFRLFADPAVQSSTTYVVRVPEDLAAAQLLKRLETDAGVVISPALHPLANTKHQNLIRFAVYSASTLEEVRIMLDALSEVAETML